MSKLQRLIDELNDATRVSSRLSAEIEAHPEDEILRVNLNSVAKRQADVAKRIDQYLAYTQNSLIEYRIERTKRGFYPAKAVGEALEKFQDLLTSVYDALVHGPKKRFRPALDTLEKTTLNFAGATSGSVRISLSAEDDRLLIGDTTMERALTLVERTLSAQTTDDLSLLASEVGIASISKAYDWAKSAAAYDLQTEITWGKGLEPESRLIIRADDAARVTQLIAHKSEDSTSRHILLCVLHGFDKQTSYFHVETIDDRAHIKGDVAASVPQVHTTGKIYRATLIRTTSILYATGEDKERWTLEELAPVDDNSVPKLP
jgi:hypothetical protein